MRATLVLICAALALAGCASDPTPSTGTTPGGTTPTTSTPASTPSGTTPTTTTPTGTTPATPSDGEEEVEMEGFAFQPANVTVPRGTAIVWKNRDSAQHTATADDDAWTTPRLTAGSESDPIVFDTAGTFPYHCEVHPTMKGTVVVT